MKSALFPLALCAAVLVAPGRPPSAALDVAPIDVTVRDLVKALDMRWWSYKLTFPAPVSGVHARPCELRRGADGSWQRTYLAPGFGCVHQGGPRFADVEIKAVLDESTPDRIGLMVNGLLQRMPLSTPADLSDTYSPADAAILVDGCLALAIDEDVPGYPHSIMGEEKYMVRVIALEITTE